MSPDMLQMQLMSAFIGLIGAFGVYIAGKGGVSGAMDRTRSAVDRVKGELESRIEELESELRALKKHVYEIDKDKPRN